MRVEDTLHQDMLLYGVSFNSETLLATMFGPESFNSETLLATMFGPESFNSETLLATLYVVIWPIKNVP